MVKENIKIGLIVRDKTYKTLYRILDLPMIKSRKNFTEHQGVYYKENKTNKTYVDTIDTFSIEFEEINLFINDNEIKDFTL